MSSTSGPRSNAPACLQAFQTLEQSDERISPVLAEAARQVWRTLYTLGRLESSSIGLRTIEIHIREAHQPYRD